MSDNKIRSISGINILLSDDETKRLIAFLCKMTKGFVLSEVIKTDENGFIVSFEPKSMPWGMIFFIQNIMINQRLRIVDQLARKEGLIK